MNRKQAKRRLTVFYILLALLLIFSISSGTALVAAQVLKDRLYSSLTESSPETDPDACHERYIRAIRLAPNRTAAYILLTEVYAQDGIFSKTENEEFFSLYSGNKATLQYQAADAPILSARIAFLYINAFEANAPTRLRMALPYLEAAEGNPKSLGAEYPIIHCYCLIGKSYQNYIWSVNQSQRISAEEIREITEAISESISVFVKNPTEDNGNSLGFCVNICNFLYDFRKDLPSAMTYTDAKALLDWVYKTLPEFSNLKGQQNAELLQYLQDNEVTLRKMIAAEFGEEETS